MRSVAESIVVPYTTNMPVVVCKICSTTFYAKPSWIARGGGKCCSKPCQNKSQMSGKLYDCYTCKKPTYRTKRDERKSKSNKFFCSKSCQTIWRNSEVHIVSNHPNWTTGQSSYRERLRKSGRKQECSRCSTKDTRLLSVHHKDRNRDNNTLSNLLFMCHNCHYLVHKYPEEAKGFLTA